MSDKSRGRRGRPLGFRLSEESKRAISESKMGQRHREETKNKISRSLIIHFRMQHPLSEELMSIYKRVDDGGVIDEWINSVKMDLDMCDDVMTIRALRNAGRIEIPVGSNIEYFSHEVTPELLVLFKEACERLNKDPMEFFDELGY
jgi:hypothetical protein